jgi:hypothetical protein
MAHIRHQPKLPLRRRLAASAEAHQRVRLMRPTDLASYNALVIGVEREIGRDYSLSRVDSEILARSGRLLCCEMRLDRSGFRTLSVLISSIGRAN